MNEKYKMKRWNVFLCFAIVALFIASCHRQPDSLEEALTLAGKNRPELEKVLLHYSSNPSDSLKLKAARFLIENMPVHYYLQKDEELYDIMDSLNRSDLSTDEVYAWFDSIKKTVRVSPTAVLPDIQTLSSGFLIRHIDDVFELWEQTPWKDKIRFGDFCEYILPYAVSSEKREYWIDYYRNKYQSFASQNMTNYGDSLNLHTICFALNDSLRKVSGMVLRPESLTDFPPLLVDNIRYGLCDNYVARVTYLMRSLGMPVGRDYAPQWGDYSRSHSWNTLIAEDGRHYPFTGFDKEWQLDFRIDCPKMYRFTYSIQNESLPVCHPREKIPAGFLNYRNIKDVTGEYLPVSDVNITVNKSCKEKIAYCCVFNNKTWMPVQWGEIKNGSVKFKDMGRKVVYLPVCYTDGRLDAINSPFKIDSACKVIPLCAGEQKETFVLTRKFHTRRIFNSFLPEILTGYFSCANKPDFSDEKIMYKIQQLPKLGFNTIDLDTVNSYCRYVRYQIDSAIRLDIAELEFYTMENNEYRKLSGKIIGTEGSCYDPALHGKHAAFDGDWLTFFSHNQDAWIGIDFGREEKIDRIRYLPRNDDNYIKTGDLYELCYWDDGKWQSLGRKIADNYVLVYENCPSGALFVLHNHTKGSEERIFTYENGKQIFW